jgi:hypothetical protein
VSTKLGEDHSYAIAKTEKKWSAHFDTASEMEYDFLKFLIVLTLFNIKTT